MKLLFKILDALINLGIKIIAGSLVACVVAGIFYCAGFPFYYHLGWMNYDPLMAGMSAWFWLCILYITVISKYLEKSRCMGCNAEVARNEPFCDSCYSKIKKRDLVNGGTSKC